MSLLFGTSRVGWPGWPRNLVSESHVELTGDNQQHLPLENWPDWLTFYTFVLHWAVCHNRPAVAVNLTNDQPESSSRGPCHSLRMVNSAVSSPLGTSKSQRSQIR